MCVDHQRTTNKFLVTLRILKLTLQDFLEFKERPIMTIHDPKSFLKHFWNKQVETSTYHKVSGYVYSYSSLNFRDTIPHNTHVIQERCNQIFSEFVESTSNSWWKDFIRLLWNPIVPLRGCSESAWTLMCVGQQVFLPEFLEFPGLFSKI